MTGQRKQQPGTMEKIFEILQRMEICQREILTELSDIKSVLKENMVGVEDLEKEMEGMQNGQENLTGEEIPEARGEEPPGHKGKEINMKPGGKLALWEGEKIKINNTTKADAFFKKHNPNPEDKQDEIKEGKIRQIGRREAAGPALRAEGGEVTRPPQGVPKKTRKWRP